MREIYYSTNVYFNTGSILYNKASFMGGVVCTSYCPYFTNSGTIRNNLAGQNGGGIYMTGDYTGVSFGDVQYNYTNTYVISSMINNIAP